MAAIWPRRGRCFRTPPNLSSISRPGSIPTPIRCRSFRPPCSSGCRIAPHVRRLAAVAAQCYGAPSADHVLPAPGTQILLPQVAMLVPPGRAAILRTTYAEHRRAASLAGHSVTEVSERRSTRARRPRHRRQSEQSRRPHCRESHAAGYRERAAAARRAFSSSMNPSPTSRRPAQASPATSGAATSWCCARSESSTASPACGSALRSRRQVSSTGSTPCSVRGPLPVRPCSSAKRRWPTAPGKSKRSTRLAEAAARLDAMLANASLEVVGGTSLYRLTRSPEAEQLFTHLGRAGILVRRFSEEPTWLRWGLPRSENEWRRLTDALSGRK